MSVHTGRGVTAGHDGVTATASPSLALIKYWGKADPAANTPATSSLALTLGGLETRTTVRMASREAPDAADSVTIDSIPQDPSRFRTFFDALREAAGTRCLFDVTSTNSFPTAAGLASSSSGFAALALAVSVLLDLPRDMRRLSAFARIGSGSAARAVYGGFTCFEAGAEAATQLFPESYWPELRVLVAVTSEEQKTHSSRSAMRHVERTSPCYPAWLEDSRTLYAEGRAAVQRRDLQALGELARASYLRMFATMLSAWPPVLYWRPESIAVIRLCEELRGAGLPAWETMDAGPQVKIVTTDAHVEELASRLKAIDGIRRVLCARPGAGARVVNETASETRGVGQ